MNFYVLNKPQPDSPEDRQGRTDAVKEKGFNTGEAVRCPHCGRFLTSLRWLSPHRIELETWGREYGDIVDVGFEMIVSDRFVQMVRRNDLKGLAEFEPVEVLKVRHQRGKPQQVMPRYFSTTVTLSSTTVDQVASGYVWRNEAAICPVCLWDDLKRFDRIVLKEGTWSSDDIFFPRGGTRLMVSERFKDLCETHAIRGTMFKNAELESYDYYPWEADGKNKG